MTDRREKIVFQTIRLHQALGFLLKLYFNALFGGFFLRLQNIDPVGESERQQHNFENTADFTGMNGPDVIR